MDEQIYTSFGFDYVVGYHDLFPNRMIPSIGKCMQGFNKKDIISVICNISRKLVGKSFYNPNSSGDSNDLGVLDFFLSPVNEQYRDEVLGAFQKMQRRVSNIPKHYIGATDETILYLMREIMAYEEDKNIKKDPATLEKDFFKALLLANDQSINRPKGESALSNMNQEMKVATMHMTQFGNSDFLYPNIRMLIVSQTVKAMSFFEYAEKDNELCEMVDDFCANNGVDIWSQYIKAFWSVYALTGGKIGFVNFDNLTSEEAFKLKTVIDRSSNTYDKIIHKSENKDYKAFRVSPVVKIDDENYLVFNYQLFIEHIFNSLYFMFKLIATTKYGYNEDNFNQYFTSGFSEKVLFVDCLKKIFNTGWDITLTDDECKMKDKSRDRMSAGPPDFYVRKGNVVILFENKDIKIRDTLKEDGRLQDYLDFMYSRFVFNEKGTGIGQLINNIKKIRNGEFQRRWDANCPQDAVVYPVLVVSDIKYTGAGTKNILQYWQWDYCDKEYLNKQMIKPLIYADIATLNLYRANFINKGMVPYFEDYYIQSNFARFEKSGDYVDMANGVASFTDYMISQEDKDFGEFLNKWLGYVSHHM